MSFTAGRKVRRSALSRIGDTYGSLTVLDIVGKDKRGKSVCTAKCVCGNIKEYNIASLAVRGGGSCGCLSSSKKLKTVESRIGDTINNMTLLEVVGRNNRGRAIGRFRCGHCGSEHKKSRIDRWKGSSLLSCGCKAPKKRTKPEQHIGKSFGYLTLLEITPRKNKGPTYGKFHCSNCGNKKNMRIKDIVAGNNISCGCRQNRSVDAIGTIFGYLKLEKVTHLQKSRTEPASQALFHCLRCGNSKEIKVANVRSGQISDCGCSKYHGFSAHKSFAVFEGMISRCTNPLHKAYPQYGGRGIKVCPRWMEPNGQGLIHYMADIGDSRPSKKHSLHRMWLYNDQNKLEECMEYGPNTVKWATARQQVIEQRSPALKKKVLEVEKYLNEGLTVDQIAEKMGRSPQKIAFFLSTLGLVKDYKYQEGIDE